MAEGARGSRLPALVLASLAVGSAAGLPATRADDHAVVLLYHHVGDDTPESTSVTPESFEAHLDYLARNDFTVLPLSELVHAVVERRPLPANSVALTFDDGYVSVYREALPRLEQRGWPFTVFVSTDAVDRGYAAFMSWDQLRDLEARGGAVGNHTTGHAHLVRREPGESEAAWRQRVRGDIVGAQARLEDKLEHPLKMLAYPYGEFDAALELLVRELGFVGLGQQSGPLGSASGRQSLPRFPVATGYDDLASLGEKLRSRPLPVTVLSPTARVLDPGAEAPALRLRIPQGPYRRSGLRCFVSGQAPAKVEWRGDEVVIQAGQPLRPGRSKYSCTAPSTEAPGVFHWYSHLWIRPNDDGTWYVE